jgi:PKD repeat protein
MKKIVSLIAVVLFAEVIIAQQWIDNLPKDNLEKGELTFFEIQKAFNDFWEPYHVKDGYYINGQGEKIKAIGWKQFRRWEWYWENRIIKETGQFPETSASDELDTYLNGNPEGKSSNGYWTSLGPFYTSGGYAGLGRLNCVGFVQGDNNTIYIGSASGGIWKTANSGTSWTPLGDFNAVLGVSDIVVVPGSNPHTIYIATGDRDGGSLWAMGGGQSNDNNSVGVLKSTDGGATWSATGLSYTASQKRTINRLLIHPNDNNILYAATSVGLYKTVNGGAIWISLTSTEFVDMEFKPGNPSILYGSTWSGDIYRSLNDGATWTTTLSTSYSRTELAVSVNNSEIVYAVLSDGSSLAGIYKSTDGGASFSQIFSGSTTNLLNWDCSSNASGGQGWYDLCIAADPTNANNVFVGGVNTWKSINGGTSWSITNHWTGNCGVSAVHADQHCLAFQNGTSTLYECNDGGFYKTTNLGTNWTHIGNGIAVSQIYRLAVAQTAVNEEICGLQDNGTKAYLSGSWTDKIGGDGFDCAIDYTTQNTLYGELYYGDIKRSTNHGLTWTSISSGLSGSAHWCTPFVIDPNINTTLYIGYQDVFKSTNQGNSWSQISTWGGSTLKSLAVAPSNSNYIYTATSSILYKTTNGGTSWSNINGTIPVGSGDITYICIKNDDPNTVWVSLGGYNTTRVYQTTNGGSTWTNISAGLPSIPVMCLIQNKQNTSQVELYAGTDVGVFVKVGSGNWDMFSTGLPNVVVTDLDIYYSSIPTSSKLRAGTFGRGVWESDLYSLPGVPVADFIANNTTPFIGQTITFTDLSNNTPTGWTWSFSPSTITYVGGTSSSSQNPQVQFNASGYYTVTLTASNTYGSDPETKSNYISVIYAPVANFNASTTTPNINQTVTFTDLSTNSPTSWSWSFTPSTLTYVGGTSASSQNPQVQFTATGYYTVALTATNGSGSNTNTKTNYINALPIAPVANFSASMTTPFVGAPVTFTDLSTNTPTSWSWAFLPSTVTYIDGTNSSSQNPHVQFDAAGNYSVTLTASNAGGADGETKTNYINASGLPPTATLQLGTLTNPTPGTVLVPVTLEAINNPILGNNLISSWGWYIAYDASKLYSAEPGTPAILTNYNPEFPSSSYLTNIIKDNPFPGWNTIAVVYASAVSGTGSTGMKFFDIVFTYTPGTTVCPNLFWTSSPTSEKGNSSLKYLSYMADDYGNMFLLSLIDGCVWSQPPVADFMASTTTPVAGTTVNFMDLSTNYPTSWAWSFSPSTVTYVNGTSSASQNPQVQFNASGTYTVTLTSTNALGADSETKTNYIAVQSSVIYLDITVFLEGPFNGTGMTPSLNSILPYNQPYNASPWYYTGTESVPAIPNPNVVDWVLVELRDATNAASATSATMMDRQAAFLLNNGKVVGLNGNSILQFTNSLTQQLFVVIWHRNHLGVMSSGFLTESDGVYSYNFSTGATQAYGSTDAHKQIGPGIWGMIGGDGNSDGVVTANDESQIWESQSGNQGYLESDYNLDTQSDNKDKDDIWTPNLGAGSQVLD